MVASLANLSLYCRFVLWTGVILFAAGVGYCGSVADLVALQAKSSNGYVTLDDGLFSQVNRDVRNGKMSLFIFFDASNHEEMSREFMGPLLEEFSVAGKSYEATRDKSREEGLERVFFCSMDLPDSEKTFSLLEIKNLPKVKFLAKDHGKTGVDCSMQEMDGKAEGFLKCLQDLSGITVGPVRRIWSVKQLLGVPLAVIGALIFLFGAWKVLMLTRAMISMPITEVLGCCLALLVYVVSISGLMYTVINKMPLYFRNAAGKLTVVLRGDEQLGLEGLVAGFLYTSAGLVLAFLMYVAPCVRPKLAQRFIAYFSLVTFGAGIYTLIYLQQWKRGG